MGKRDPGGSLLEALQTGPKDGRELLRLSGMSKRTLYHRLGSLEQERCIAVFPLRQRDRWVSLYALPEHATRATRLSGFEPVQEGRREAHPPPQFLGERPGRIPQVRP